MNEGLPIWSWFALAMAAAFAVLSAVLAARLKKARREFAGTQEREKEILATMSQEDSRARLELAEARRELERVKQQSAQAGSEAINAEIVSFLSLLQSRGRFIDFLMDDITGYEDAQVGAAARVVHQGCASVIREFFDIVPVQTTGEGEAVTLGPDYNRAQFRLVGRVTGNPPFKGVLLHKGWRTRKVTLPRLATASATPREIITPAEVELH